MPAAVLVLLGAIGLVQGFGLAGLGALLALGVACVAATALLRPRQSDRREDNADPAAGLACGEIAGVAGTEANQAGAEAPAGSHFTRHATSPGWIYVARNDLHAPDLYKVGYTTVSPRARVASLNRQGEGVTVAVGEFRLLHARQVPRSYTAEQLVFDLLSDHRARQHREFFQAPIQTVLAAVDAVADKMAQEASKPGTAERVSGAAPGPVLGDAHVSDTCPACRSSLPHPASNEDGQALLTCADCGARWFIGVHWYEDEPGSRRPTA